MSKRLNAIIIPVFLIFLILFNGVSYAQQLSDSELMKDVNSEELQEIIDSYEGEKAVLVNMWATWCGPCVEEFPHIVKLQRKYEDQLQVVFVSADFDKQAALEFLREQEVDWQTFFKTGKDEVFINSLSDKWTGAMPFTKILNPEGNLVASWENKADFSTFETNVKQALNP
ncbi:TlpA family protein disulfide reductase [Aliifodinibius sp. S!AR15-10]|uniref:TlpA family protein disulfide reductase n=1 Tax=Aliifodinibius sp. S!AR15-10 TaxID=2950437 RepID=UPI002860CE85|nr:TlpA disulfide reductase family protein [Aliifodinibius sp. S!AR15-10]MDR8391787.1 TlpA family protein disulfide reductase [Aliifodinibius sp. S!AR15-10]